MKKIILFIVTILIVGCGSKQEIQNTPSHTSDKQYNYIIDITINAPKEKVWNIVTDFKNYPKWNSVLKMENNDNLGVGQKFNVTIYDKDGSIQDNFEAITVTKATNKEFSASRTIWTKFFFKATHHFVIEEVSSNQVRFFQKWELEGAIGYLFEGMIFDVLDLFKTMNLELKTVAEK